MSEPTNVIEERNIREEVSGLGRKTLYKTEQGIVRESALLFCLCGRKLDPTGKLALCCNCSGKLGEECEVTHQGKTYCVDCLHAQIGLSLPAMKVLLSAASERWTEEILNTWHLQYAELSQAVNELLARELITKRFLSSIRGYKITHHGLDILPACRKLLDRLTDKEGRTWLGALARR